MKLTRAAAEVCVIFDVQDVEQRSNELWLGEADYFKFMHERGKQIVTEHSPKEMIALMHQFGGFDIYMKRDKVLGFK